MDLLLSTIALLLVLIAGVVLPLVLFTSIYIFTNVNLIVHVNGSLPRLMLSPALVAILLIAFALPPYTTPQASRNLRNTSFDS